MTDVMAGKGQVKWRENGKQNGRKKMNTMTEKLQTEGREMRMQWWENDKGNVGEK